MGIYPVVGLQASIHSVECVTLTRVTIQANLSWNTTPCCRRPTCKASSQKFHWMIIADSLHRHHFAGNNVSNPAHPPTMSCHTPFSPTTRPWSLGLAQRRSLGRKTLEGTYALTSDRRSSWVQHVGSSTDVLRWLCWTLVTQIS